MTEKVGIVTTFGKELLVSLILFFISITPLSHKSVVASLSYNQHVALSHTQLIMTQGFNNSWGICWGHTLLGFYIDQGLCQHQTPSSTPHTTFDSSNVCPLLHSPFSNFCVL
jgi:hypothetical protein